MLLPDKGVKLLFKHSTSIINIFHFESNAPNHFISLSDDSEIVEFLFIAEEEKVLEIEKFHIKRPDNDLLERNGHIIQNLKRGQYYKITQVLQFENFLVLGYDDGLILVYNITKRELNNNERKNEIKSKNKNDEEEEENEEVEENKEQNKELKYENINDENKNDINDNQKGNGELNYSNYFSLYYILLGHTDEILSLCYIPQLKILISSSNDSTLKIFDFTTGHLTHFFKFDFIITKILYQNISKTKEPKIILTLLSSSPLKVIINLSTNPITSNTQYFEHIDILQLEKIKDKFYGINSKNIKILDKNLELEGNLICLNNINLQYFYKYKNDFYIIDNENMVRMVTFNIKKKNKAKEDNKSDKNKKKNPKNEEPDEEEEKTYESVIKTEYKFKVGEDNINGFYPLNNFIFAFSRDGSLLLINFEKIQESFETLRMTKEDEASLKMMEFLAQNKKSKKGKKDKTDKKDKAKKEKKKKK